MRLIKYKWRMKPKKITAQQAITIAQDAGVDFSSDFHAQSMGTFLTGLAKLAGYKKSATSSGSTGRAYFLYLKNKAK